MAPVIARLMVTLLPMSADDIKRQLGAFGAVGNYELHFSLFCFLEHAPGLPGAEHFAAEVPSLISDYLTHVPRDTARAAWMAGDLLGEHWQTPFALPVLVECAHRARFAAGRAGAVHGLAHLLTRVSGHAVDHVRTTLGRVAETDRSRRVRFDAQLILDGSDPCAGPLK